MDSGAEFIGMFKTNTTLFCNETIEKLTQYWTGGSYLVLSSKHMATGVGLLIYIEYKYNTHRVLPFSVTYNTSITKSGLPYFFNYPDQFSNVSVLPVARPLVVYKFFGSVNEVGSHNKSRQSELAL